MKTSKFSIRRTILYLCVCVCVCVCGKAHHETQTQAEQRRGIFGRRKTMTKTFFFRSSSSSSSMNTRNSNRGWRLICSVSCLLFWVMLSIGSEQVSLSKYYGIQLTTTFRSSSPSSPSSPEEEEDDHKKWFSEKVIDETGHYIRLLSPETRLSINDLKLPTPIFILSLPKSGTSTIHDYFNCGLGDVQNYNNDNNDSNNSNNNNNNNDNTTLLPPLLLSAHNKYPTKVNRTEILARYYNINKLSGRYHSKRHFSSINSKKYLILIGDTMSYNVKFNQPLLSSNTSEEKSDQVDDNNNSNNDDDGLIGRDLNEYKIFGNVEDMTGGKLFLFTDALENIKTYYPNSTLLYIRRDPKDWYHSASNWSDLLYRFRTLECSNLTDSFFNTNSVNDKTTSSTRKKYMSRNEKQNESFWLNFYNNYENYIRNFAYNHPTLTYLEVPLNTNTTGQVLEEKTGISRLCFGHKNKNNDKKIENTVQITYF